MKLKSIPILLFVLCQMIWAQPASGYEWPYIDELPLPEDSHYILIDRPFHNWLKLKIPNPGGDQYQVFYSYIKLLESVGWATYSDEDDIVHLCYKDPVFGGTGSLQVMISTIGDGWIILDLNMGGLAMQPTRWEFMRSR